MNILFDISTNNVVGVNSPSTPFTYSVDVEDNFNLTKSIEEQEGMKHKVNEQGEPLYLKEIYRTEYKEVIIGQDETIEVTDKPIMIQVQKVDEEGRKLYLEAVINDLGEVVDHFETINAKDDLGVNNEPIMLSVQKTSTSGKLLYLKDIIERVPYEVLESTEEVTDSENILEPIMIPNVVRNYYSFDTNPTKFNVDEVLAKKYQSILDNSLKDYLVADMFLTQEDIDLADPKHSANTGVALLQLLPNGQAKTKTIELSTPSSVFEILDFSTQDGVELYLSGKKFVDNKLILSNPVSSCTIKFINTTDKPKLVYSYAIGY